jgi:hypothetical protein
MQLWGNMVMANPCDAKPSHAMLVLLIKRTLKPSS